MTLLDRTGQANVIFSSEPVEPGIDSTSYAAIQEELLSKEFEGYRPIATEQMRMLGGRDGILHRFDWQPPGSPRVSQIQIYCVEGGRGYTATATTHAAIFSSHSSVLTEIIDRLRIDDASGPSGGGGGEARPEPGISVSNNKPEERYEVRREGEIAGLLHYRLRSSLIAPSHTEVFERFQGRGLGNRLIVSALEDARAQGLEVLPFCPLVSSYIQKHPEWIDLVPSDQRADFGLTASRLSESSD